MCGRSDVFITQFHLCSRSLFCIFSESSVYDKSSLIAKLITNETGSKLGNNILNIDNSRTKKSTLVNSNQLSKLSNTENSALQLNNGNNLNGASCFRNDKSSLNKTTTPFEKTAFSSTKQTSNSKFFFQESVERRPQLNQQQNSSSDIIKQFASFSSSSTNPHLDQPVDLKKEKKSFKNFFKFSSNKQQSSNNNSTNLKRQSELSDSKSSLTSANQDRVVDSLIVNDLVEPTNLLPKSGYTVSIESAKFAKTTSTDAKSRTDEISSLLVQHNSLPTNQQSTVNKLDNKNLKSIDSTYNSFQTTKLLNKTSTVNNSLNHSENSAHLKEENRSSTASSILPSSQSSFLSNHHNYSLNNKNQTHHLSNSKINENQKFQFNKESFDSTDSSEQIVNNLSTHHHTSDYADPQQFTKTVSTNNQVKLNLNCLNCGDQLKDHHNFKNSMSNASNPAAAAAAAMQNSDAYQHLSQLSAQQLNQLIMDQAFMPQNTSNSTHSNSLSNHGATNHDSESSEQFRRLLCRKCRPNRTGIMQHSHNSNSKFARNLHTGAMNQKYGWNALKEYSKGSIKRLKRHQKRLTGYARAMRKQYNGSGSSALASGDLSDSAHQAALANMVLNAMNTNKLNNLNNSPNFCKECYLEKMLQQSNNGLINNDYQIPNKNVPPCLSCYNNLNNALSMINTQSNFEPLAHNQKSNDFVDNALVDRFWDVEQWRNKLRKERLRKKERNVLMIVSSIAIIVFIGISYFGTILFLRLTRLQNEET